MTKLEKILQQRELERQMPAEEHKAIKVMQEHIDTLKKYIGAELSNLFEFSILSDDEFEVKSTERPQFKFFARLFKDKQDRLFLECDDSMCRLQLEGPIEQEMIKDFFLWIVGDKYAAWKKQKESLLNRLLTKRHRW